MSQPERLPQWPPRALAFGDSSFHSRRQQGSSIDHTFRPQPKFETTATSTAVRSLGDRRQPQSSRSRLPEHPAAESVLDVPIFRGDCWSPPDAAEGEDGWETCSLEERSLDASAVEGAVPLLALGRSPRTPTSSAVGTGADSSRRNDQAIPSVRPALSSGPDSGSTENSLRVRFAPEVEALGQTATSPRTADGLVAGRGQGEAPPSIQAAARERREEEVYVSPDGQPFVRRRNGMHTAWRRRAVNSNDNPSSPPHQQQSPGSVVPVGDGTAVSPTAAHDGSRSRDLAPHPASGGPQAASADQLITMSSNPSTRGQQPRLFLRRAQNADAVSTTSPASARGDATHAYAGPVLQARGGSNGVDRAGLRRTRGAPVARQAFPPRWARPRAGTGADAGRVDRSDIDIRHKQAAAGAAPPPAVPASEQRKRRSGTTSTGADVDENSHPSPGRLPSPPALLSSAAVRQNLARVARRSKVGTTADPVTLYRHRQELERARVKRAAARSREKDIREARSCGRAAWGVGGVPGAGGRLMGPAEGSSRGG
ncbi:unnamed protein product, partial [Scytosiphon promiscuus]